MKVITNYKTTLSASMTSSQNTVPVSSLLTTDGHTITAADFDSVAYLVIEPGAANMEIVKVTGVSGSSFTGAVRGLAFYGGTETAVSANQKAHQAGSAVIMTNAHYYFDKMMDLDSNETVTGIKTFTAPNYPKMDDVSTPPVDDEEFATKKYADDLAIAGSPKATETVYGIAKLSSAAADPTAPVVVNNEEVSAAGGDPDGINKVIKANASGTIDKDYIELDTDPGLEFDSNALGVKIKTSGGIVKDSDGLSVDTGTTDGKIVQVTTGDKLPAIDGSALTNLEKIYQQFLPYYNGSETSYATAMKISSDIDGSSFTVAYPVSQKYYLLRFQKDTNSGMYILTHTKTNCADMGSNVTALAIAYLGNYIYITTGLQSGSKKLYRYDKADFGNEQEMTISGTAYGGTAAFSDGTNLYIYKTTNEFAKYTISGTTATYDSVITYTDAGNVATATTDNTYVYLATNDASATLRKYLLVGGAVISTGTDIFMNIYTSVSARGLIIIKSGYLGICRGYMRSEQSVDTGALVKIDPITAF